LTAAITYLSMHADETTQEKDDRPMTALQKLCSALAICAGAYWVTFWRFFLSNNSDLQMLLDGTGHRPYQLRALVPLVDRYLAAGLAAAHVRPLPVYVSSQLMLTNLLEAQVVFFVEAVLLVALVMYVWHYLNLLLRNEVTSFMSSLLVLAVLPFHYMYGGFPIFYPYDTASILVFVLGLIFLLEKKTLPFYLLLLVGTCNRETTIFLVLLHVLVNWKTSARSWIALHLGAQTLLWIAVKLLLSYAYQDNTGDLLQIHAWKNVQRIFFATETATAGGLYGWVTLATVFGFLWVPVLLFRQWIRNDFVRSTLLVIPFFAAGMMAVGVITEIRIFGELIPVVLSAFALIATNAARTGPSSPRTSS
jgi:hypothetical protein